MRYVLYILNHKWKVARALLRMRPDLIWLALVHDWHKFLPSEFFPYRAKMTWGGGFRFKPVTTKSVDDAFNVARYLHYGRSHHHPEKWGTHAIPDVYLWEMVADWLAMNDLDHEATAAWYARTRSARNPHPYVLTFLDFFFGYRQITGNLLDYVYVIDDHGNIVRAYLSHPQEQYDRLMRLLDTPLGRAYKEKLMEGLIDPSIEAIMIAHRSLQDALGRTMVSPIQES